MVALSALGALLVLVLATCLADDSSAVTINVPADQTSIMKAVDVAKAGDTVLVSSGYYQEDIRISKSITLKCARQHNAVLSNPGYAAVVKISSPGVTIANFKIEGDTGLVGVLVSNVADVTLEGLLIVNCDKGILAESGTDLEVRGCTIKGSATTGLKVVGTDRAAYEKVVIRDTILDGNKGEGIWLLYCREVEMDGLTVKGNAEDGIRSSKVVGAHLRNSNLNANLNGLKIYDSHGWVVEDSVFQSNRWNGIELNQSGGDKANELRRNLISDNSKAQDSSTAGIMFFGRLATDNLVEHNIITSNPIGLNLISPAGGCWHNTFRANKITKCGYALWENSGTGPNNYHLNNFLDNSVNVAAVNSYSTFDQDELGNFWSDYASKYPVATKDGPVWTTPYKVKLGTGVFDMYPLAYRYEQDPPVIDRIVLIDEIVLVPGYPANFGAGAYDASAIVDYRWTVLPVNGPESSYTTSGHTFTFTFKYLGLHWLTVEVTDVWGFSAGLTEEFRVEDIIPPVAEAGPDRTVNLGSNVVLDGTGSTDNHVIASISWLFDPDGHNLIFQSSYATFTINKLGIYQAQLFVVDHAGNAATDWVTIIVKDLTPPLAVTSGDARVSLGERVTFDGSSSTDNVGVVQWRWTVIKGSALLVTILEPTFDHIFTEEGRYEVTLTVKDAEGNSDRETMRVTVVDMDPPVAEAGRDQEVLMGVQVNLDATASTDNVGITRYEWSFRYGPKNQYLSGIEATWRFDVPGEYQVTLVVYDSAGNHNTDVLMINVVDTDPPVAMYWVTDEVKLGETMIMDASGSEDNVGITSYEWQVTRNKETLVLRGAMAELPVNDPGWYKVTLVIRDAAGNEDTEEWSFYVPPKASTAEAPSWLVPAMVAVVAAAVLVGYLYARRRYGAG